jgi:hypothetical protein
LRSRHFCTAVRVVCFGTVAFRAKTDVAYFTARVVSRLAPPTGYLLGNAW